ncbi:MAG: metallophosphoesterase [Planctomycetota bacterium]|jgi:predicted MPP superfamily phosphohydrolase
MATSELIAALLFVAVIFAVYCFELVLVAVFAYNKLKGRKTSNILRRKYALFVHALAIIGMFCFVYGYFIEPYWIEVNIIPIHTEKLANTSFRIVHFSDTHCDKKIINEDKLVELVRSLKPDVVVFTGDALNTGAALPLFKDTMSNLNAALAKLAVHGNFDINSWSDLDLYGGTGFQLLDQKTVTLEKDGEKIALSGLGCQHHYRFRGLLEDVNEDLFSVFLYHFSDLVEDLGGLNVDLYLCGHTHGGQVVLPFYGALITLSKFGKKYESGMYKVNDTIVYVNRGIGLEVHPAPKVRFLARPEITVFDIKPAGGD